MDFLDFLKYKIKPISEIIWKISQHGGVCFLVGGVVRDLFLSQIHNYQLSQEIDIDIEVHKLSIEELQKILESFSTTLLVGKQFGVLRMPKFGQVDWSLPRQDSVGRKPKVELDKDLTIDQALFRRDVSINGMALNLTEIVKKISSLQASPQTLLQQIESKLITLYDPFDGLQHLKEKVIHPISQEKFIEDPLRFFRVMQMLARFQFQTSKEMDALATKMKLERSNQEDPAFIAKERIGAEVKKMITKSTKPSMGFAWIKKLGRLEEIFPALHQASISGSWETFCNQLDLARQATPEDEDQQMLFCCTIISFWIKNSARLFFKGLAFSEKLIESSTKLAKTLQDNPNLNAELDLKLLAKKLEPLSLSSLLPLGQILEVFSPEKTTRLLKQAKDLSILLEPTPALVGGEDLLEFIKPGPKIGAALRKAYLIQMTSPMLNKNDIIKMIKSKDSE